MHVCGGQTGHEVWFGVVFESRTEAENVMKFLENGIEKTCKVDSKQTVKEKGTKNE
jgi:hypothetical protein